MRKVELHPLENQRPGDGQLVIIGWEGEREGLAVDIQRNQDECFLQGDGEWRSNAFRFHLPTLQPTREGHLAASVDHEIIDPLLESSHATNRVRLFGRDGNQVGQARLRLGKGLMPSGARGNAPELESGAALNSPQPAPPSEPQATSEQVPSNEPEPPVMEAASAQPAASESPSEPSTPAARSRGKRWLWILLAALIAIIILAAAAWLGLSMRDKGLPGLENGGAAVESEAGEPNAGSAPQVTPASDDIAAATPCSLQRMGEVGELEFIQSCTGSDRETSDMLEVISNARDNNHCGIARRLYAHQALNGDAASALAYAREFDPAQHSPSACFPEPDAETAIFWYETALGLDADNAEASQRLEALQG